MRRLAQLPEVERPHQGNAGHEERRGDEQEVQRTDRLGERGGDERTCKAAEARSRSDETEHPVGLLAAEDVRHEAPEHGQPEQVHHRQPYEERAGNPGVVLLEVEPRVEQDEIRGKKDVKGGKQRGAPHPRSHRAEYRLDRQGADERRPEQYRQLRYAGRDAHRLPDRPQDRVSRPDQEQQHEGTDEAPYLFAAHRERAHEQAGDRAVFFLRRHADPSVSRRAGSSADPLAVIGQQT